MCILVIQQSYFIGLKQVYAEHFGNVFHVRWENIILPELGLKSLSEREYLPMLDVNSGLDFSKTQWKRHCFFLQCKQTLSRGFSCFRETRLLTWRARSSARNRRSSALFGMSRDFPCSTSPRPTTTPTTAWLKTRWERTGCQSNWMGPVSSMWGEDRAPVKLDGTSE